MFFQMGDYSFTGTKEALFARFYPAPTAPPPRIPASRRSGSYYVYVAIFTVCPTVAHFLPRNKIISQVSESYEGEPIQGKFDSLARFRFQSPFYEEATSNEKGGEDYH